MKYSFSSLFLLLTTTLIFASDLAIAKSTIEVKIVLSESKLTQNKILNITAGNPAAIELSTVKNRTDLLQSNGRLIKLIGYYVSQSWNPGMASNTFDFKGIYNVSQIVLEDGTLISIFPHGQKQSLRFADEVNKCKGKIVEAIGVVKSDTKSADRSKSPEFFIDLKELKLVK
jgi:hypothetical protein